MIREWLSQFEPEQLRKIVYLGQAVLGGAFLAALFYLRSRPNQLSFRAFEADLKGRKKTVSPGRPEKAIPHDPEKSSPSTQKPGAPLRLGGIVTTGLPHEILGIAADANGAAIQKAFRELMKRYHPDKVGPAGSREWKDAQRIADAIIRAKEAMLKSATHREGSAHSADPSRNPKRSGR